MTPRRWNVSWPEELLLVALFVMSFAIFRGLYGAVPFLMSLGVSSIVAVLGLYSSRLVSRDDVRFGGWRLRRSGRLTRAGWVYVAIAVVSFAFCIHSAFVRLDETSGTRWYGKTAGLRKSALDLGSPLFLAQGEDRVLVDRAIRTLERSERWGLFANPRTPLKLAWLNLLAGREKGFAQQIDAALLAQPGAAEVHLLRGREMVATRRFQEAIEAYSRAIDCEPQSADGYLSLGTLLAGLGRIDPAIDVFVRGIEILPNDADLHYNSGIAYAMRGNLEVAVEHFEKALIINPDHLKAKENLAGLLAFAEDR